MDIARSRPENLTFILRKSDTAMEIIVVKSTTSSSINIVLYMLL